MLPLLNSIFELSLSFQPWRGICSVHFSWLKNHFGRHFHVTCWLQQWLVFECSYFSCPEEVYIISQKWVQIIIFSQIASAGHGLEPFHFLQLFIYLFIKFYNTLGSHTKAINFISTCKAHFIYMILFYYLRLKMVISCPRI